MRNFTLELLVFQEECHDLRVQLALLLHCSQLARVLNLLRRDVGGKPAESDQDKAEREGHHAGGLERFGVLGPEKCRKKSKI